MDRSASYWIYVEAPWRRSVLPFSAGYPYGCVRSFNNQVAACSSCAYVVKLLVVNTVIMSGVLPKFKRISKIFCYRVLFDLCFLCKVMKVGMFTERVLCPVDWWRSFASSSILPFLQCQLYFLCYETGSCIWLSFPFDVYMLPIGSPFF